MVENYRIELGIQFDDAELKNIKKQLTDLNDNTYRIKVDIDNSRLLKQIEHAKKELKGLNDTKGGNKTSLNINTKGVEESLGRVEHLLDEISKSLNTLDGKSGIQSLVGSIKEITTVLGKAENESDSLMKSLSALSKKDFSINLNLKAGNANPVKSMADYGDEVRNNVIPQLEKRVEYFRKALGGYENAKSELTRLMTSKYGAKGADRAASLTDSLGDDSSLSKQMNAYKKYLGYMQEIASKKNALLLNDYNFQFPVSPEELIADAKKIQSGTKDVEESFEKLKQVVGGGVNAEGLAAQLEPVINKLEEVRKTIENLSKTTAFDGLSQSFKELSDTLNNLLDNYSLVKKNLDGIGDGLGSSGTTGVGLENVENDLKEVSSVVDIAENSIDSLKKTLTNLGVNSTGIDLITKDIQEMGIEVQRVKTEISGNSLKLSITGLKEAEDGIKRIVNEVKTFDVDNKKNIKRSVVDTLETSVDRQKAETKKVNEVYKEIYNTKKRIGSLEVDLIKTEDVKDAQNIRNEIERLKKSLNSLDADGSYASKFTDKQKADLKELENQIGFNKTNAEREVEIKLEAQIEKEEIKEVEESFKELKRLAKEMGNYDIKIAGLEASGDINGAEDLRKALDKTEKEFAELENRTQLTKTQVRELDQIFANTADEIRKFNETLSKKTGEQEKAAGLERLKSITKEIAQLNIELFNSEDAGNIERITARLNELENEASELRTELQRKFNITSFDEIDDIARKGAEALDKLQRKLNEINAEKARKIKIELETDLPEEVKKIKASISTLPDTFTEVKVGLKAVDAAMDNLNAAVVAGDNEKIVQSYKELVATLKIVEKQYDEIQIAQKNANSNKNLELKKQGLSLEMDNWLKDNSAAAKKFGKQIQQLKSQLQSCDGVEFNNIKGEFQNLQKEAKSLGLTTQTLGDRLRTQFSKYSAYFGVAEIFMYAEQGLRDMFEQVKLIDSAMTELKKVTNETDESYNNFLTNAGSRAKEIGTTIDGLVSSTADFARLGYDFADAQGLAEVANIYAVVGDEIEGVEGATESLISTLAAFKSEMNGLDDADFALSIVDKMNEVELMPPNMVTY